MNDQRIDWNSGYDEAVEVNQRALIDKVLARYSAEFTIFRELLQNADDAHSTAVEIHFQSSQFLSGQLLDDDKLPNLKTAPVTQWIFKNNGDIFREEDWNRLKKIAEGNPNEETIGAFGVGFYSLFSITDEPKVLSDNQWMWFHWNKDQLLARRGKTDPSASDFKTEIRMPLREEAPIPVAFDLTRFLASSITFMATLSNVDVFFDNKCLAKLSKSTGVPRPIEIPPYIQVHSNSDKCSMRIVGLKDTPVTIDAQVMRWVYSSGTQKPPPPTTIQPVKPAAQSGWRTFFSTVISKPATPQPPPPPELPVDLLAISPTTVSLSIISAEVALKKIDKKLEQDLERSTKKQPPRTLRYDLIYTGKDEYDASRKLDEEQTFATGSVFQGLRADLEGTGAARIFIGHATAQTTGLGGHMSSRFIPTVERESIDLMDRSVAVWNRELLFIGGIVARIGYEKEMREIKQKWDEHSTAPSAEIQSELRSKAIHAMKFFTFYPSTPSSDIASLLEAAFYSCTIVPRFPFMSSTGIRDVADVRLPDASFSFLKQLPVLPEDIAQGARHMITALQNRGLIKPILPDDVWKELRARPLTVEELTSCLQWWTSLDKSNIGPTQLAALLDAAVLIIGQPGGANERIIPLSTIKTFYNRSRGLNLPMDGPLPPHMLPESVSKNLTATKLSSHLGWKDLTMVDWLDHLRTDQCPPEYDMRLSPPWAENVLQIIASWASRSPPQDQLSEIIRLLKSIPCLPTSKGMKRPEEAYFASADIFHDLPVVTLLSGGSFIPNSKERQMEALLMKLQVRKHVELQIIFDRMVKTKEWTSADLVKYLASVQDTLTSTEMKRLEETVAFTAEGDAMKRYSAKQLYVPDDTFRQMGLPVLDWGTNVKWNSRSNEANFLFRLKLQRHPSAETLVRLCSGDRENVRDLALTYLINNIPAIYNSNEFDPYKHQDVRFIPAQRSGVSCLCTPNEVYVNSKWAAFGLPILRSDKRDIASKLRLKDHPPASALVNILTSCPPKDEVQAKEWFQILAGHVAEFSGGQLQRLSQTPMIPVGNQEKGGIQYRCPVQCYFGKDARAAFHSKLFLFIDFGQVANGFLTACGVKPQPTTDEVAQMLLADPRNFYELAGGSENFLIELKAIAANNRLLSSGTIMRMKRAPVLLAYQRKQLAGKGALEDEERELHPVGLKRADQVIVADDTNSFQLFGDALCIAPQDTLLEDFYILLGSRRLSLLVTEDAKRSEPEIKNSKQATEIRHLILERLPLFLHEHTHAKTRHPFSWLKIAGNFVVKAYGKVSMTKSLHFNDLRLTKTHDASAVAQVRSGCLEIWIAGHTQPDMYEVAMSFNRFFFHSPTANDTLLFMTLLSSDLRSLKRRGYNGMIFDRILRDQKAQQAAIKEEQDRVAQERATQEKARQETLLKTPLIPPPPPYEKDSTGNVPPPPPESSTARHSGSIMGNLRQKLSNIATANSGPMMPGGLPSPPPPIPDKTRPAISQKNPTQGATPLQNIAANIDTAIRGCRAESGNLLKNREQMQQVKETLNEGYCDVSGRAGNLQEIGMMGRVKVYLSEEVPQTPTFMTEKRDSIARLVHIMTILSDLYAVPLTSLHVFYDLGGGMIAFNRNGSIFFNLRYYEAWHDDDVKTGRMKNALISWHGMSVSVQSATTVSSIRRKPQFTYQSPSANEFREPTKLIVHSKKPLTSSKPTTSPGPTLSTLKPPTPPSKTNTFPAGSSLPLYHPLGRLALSLPPLDPAKYGLPVPIRADPDLLPQPTSTANGKSPWQTTSSNASNRREPSAAVSAAAVEEPNASSSTLVDKPSPRKRRGGPGGARKRRKEVDEDASYPATAKRPRLPRGAASAANSNVEEDGEEASAAVADATEERKPERRTTRSRGAAARRDSNASETSGSASNSVSVTRAASAVRKEEGGDVVMSSEKAEGGIKRRSRSKEEGEVSEESK
ncbi:hypothetical protein VNI00_012053 [Paramarasmius palmivorus]|uniref:Sacsin/Nov domain-containing protein n=1 Tax=Paramarasmius palmivorus TaxID=297713 RepID=A0AAW0C6H8_9AGAR